MKNIKKTTFKFIGLFITLFNYNFQSKKPIEEKKIIILKKYPKIFELFNRKDVYIEKYICDEVEYEAIEYFFNKLNVSPKLAKDEYSTEFYVDCFFEESLDKGLLMTIIQYYFPGILASLYTSKDLDDSFLKNFNNMMNFINELDINDEDKNKLLNRYTNEDEDFLKKILTNKQLVIYKDLYKKANDEMENFIINNNISIDEKEINNLITSLENFIEIKLSSKLLRKMIKEYIIYRKKSMIRNKPHYDEFFFLTGSTSYVRSMGFQSTKEELISIIIIDEIIKTKLKKENYPLINYIRYRPRNSWGSFQDFIREPMDMADKKKYNDKLMEHNITYEDLLDYLTTYEFFSRAQYKSWDELINKMIEIKNKKNKENK